MRTKDVEDTQAGVHGRVLIGVFQSYYGNRQYEMNAHPDAVDESTKLMGALLKAAQISEVVRIIADHTNLLGQRRAAVCERLPS